MSRYKIEITVGKTKSLCTVFVRKWWFWWYVVDNCIHDIPYNETVLHWKTKYSIPEKSIHFQFDNKLN